MAPLASASAGWASLSHDLFEAVGFLQRQERKQVGDSEYERERGAPGTQLRERVVDRRSVRPVGLSGLFQRVCAMMCDDGGDEPRVLVPDDLRSPGQRLNTCDRTLDGR